MDLTDFRLGFICASRTQQLGNRQELASWNRVLTAHHKFFVHPQNSVLTVTDLQGRSVIAVGDIFVAHGEDDLTDLLIRIADGDREALDVLSGRFALFILDGETGTVLHDPIGSQSVFYSLGPGSVVSSHAALLARAIGTELSPDRRAYMKTDAYAKKTTRFLPGDMTLYDQIVHLVPNNELDMRTGATRRFWPRRSVSPATLRDLHDVWSEYFSHYAKFLSARYNQVTGLTGGLDSRTVIATLRAMGTESRYVTWNMGEAEAARIPALVRHLASRHDWLRLSSDAVAPEFQHIRTAAQEATGFTRGSPVRPAVMAAIAGPRDVFIKGDGGAIMGGPWHASRKPWLPEDPATRMYRLYAGQQAHEADALYVRTTQTATADFIRRANYGVDLHGCDVGDLFYWEQRMGNWGSLQHAELGVAMQSHAAMNSRRLFETAWGLPLEQRDKQHLLPGLMARFDPVLAEL